MVFYTNPDGSTKWILAQLSDFHGFAVVDFATHKEIHRIKLPDTPPGKTAIHEGGNISHGMAITSGAKTVIVNRTLNSCVYMYSLPDLKLIGSTDVGMTPHWIDIDSRKEVTRIPVGQVPTETLRRYFLESLAT